MESAQGCVIKVCTSSLKLEELIKKVSELNKGNIVVQIFDDESLINETHVIGSYVNALESFRAGSNIAKTPALELLLYVAMTRQINIALKAVGAKSNKGFVLFCNSKIAHDEARKLVKTEKEFKRTDKEAKKIAKKYGIDQAEDLNQFILQKIALSRIED